MVNKKTDITHLTYKTIFLHPIPRLSFTLQCWLLYLLSQERHKGQRTRGRGHCNISSLPILLPDAFSSNVGPSRCPRKISLSRQGLTRDCPGTTDRKNLQSSLMTALQTFHQLTNKYLDEELPTYVKRVYILLYWHKTKINTSRLHYRNRDLCTLNQSDDE